MKKRIVFSTLLFCSICTLSLNAKEVSVPDQFIGAWGVHYERTVEAGKKSPKYNDGDHEAVAAMLKRVVDSTEMRIGQDSLAFKRGTRVSVLPIEVQKASKKKMKAFASLGAENAELNFKLLKGGFMQFQSSATDDMDFYVWEKLDLEEADES